MRLLLAILLFTLTALGTERLSDCQKTEGILAEGETRAHAVKALFAYLTHDIRGMTDEDLELYLEQPRLVNPVPFASQINDTQRHVVGKAFRDELKGLSEEEKVRVWEDLRSEIQRVAREKKGEKHKRDKVRTETSPVITPFLLHTYPRDYSESAWSQPLLVVDDGKPGVLMDIQAKGISFFPLLESEYPVIEKSRRPSISEPVAFEMNGRSYVLFADRLSNQWLVYDVEASKALDPALLPDLVRGHIPGLKLEKPVVFRVGEKPYLAGVNNGEYTLEVFELGKTEGPVSRLPLPIPVPDAYSNFPPSWSNEEKPIAAGVNGRTLIAMPVHERNLLIVADPLSGAALVRAETKGLKHGVAYQEGAKSEIALTGNEGIGVFSFQSGKVEDVDNSTKYLVTPVLFQSGGATYATASGIGENGKVVGIWNLSSRNENPVKIPAPALLTELKHFRFGGRDLIAWGEAGGVIALADRSGEVIRGKIANAEIKAIIPFMDGETAEAFVQLNESPPVIIQLAGLLPKKKTGGP